MKIFENIPKPQYLLGAEEAQELAQPENLIESKGPIPFSYCNIKKAMPIVLKYRKEHRIGNMIQVLPNPNNSKMKLLDATIFNAKCPFTGIYYGRYMGMRNDAHIWAPVVVSSEPKTLYLEREADLADWMIIRLYSNLYGSHLNIQLGEKPLFYIKDEKSEMQSGFDTATLMVDVIEKVKRLSSEMLLMTARQLGLTTVPGVENNLSVKDITGFVLQSAMKDPKIVLDIITASSAAVSSVLTSAVYSGVIFQDHTGFTYKGNLIGRTREEVIQVLQNDSKQFQMISMQAKNSDKLALRIEKEMAQASDEPPVIEDKDNF